MKHVSTILAVLVLSLIAAVGCGKKNNNNVNPYGTYGTYPGAYPGGYPGGYGYDQNYYIGTLSNIDRTTYKYLLQDSGMCNRGIINWGSEKCKRYANGGRVEMRISGSTVTVSIVSSNSMAAYSGPAAVYNAYIPNNVYPGSAPAAYAPVTFSGTLANYGNGYGFQSWSGLDGYFNTTTIQPGMQVELFYQGARLGTANMVRPY